MTYRIFRKQIVAVLIAVCILCVTCAIFCLQAVSAEETEANYYYYVNVGSEEFTQSDKEYRLDLGSMQDGATSDRPYSQGSYGYTQEGVLTEGDTLFESHRTDAEYVFTLENGSYQVAFAVEGNVSVEVDGVSVLDNSGLTDARILSGVFSVNNGTLTVSVEGDLCGILIAAPDSKILMYATWTEGQVLPYGSMTQLENAQGYYSDGSIAETRIEYDPIAAGGGVNVNFNTTDVTGKLEGTDVVVSRYVITMPEDLVYFINAGSVTGIPEEDWLFPGESENDIYYDHNGTVFDYYAETLLNTVPDQASTGETVWGYYTNSYVASKQFPQSAGDSNPPAYPFNSARVTGMSTHGTSDLGYRLTGLTPGAEYHLYLGTMSYWHQRTVGVMINGSDMGSLTIRASRDVTLYKSVKADENGILDIYLTGQSQDEANLIFLALQEGDAVVADVPESLTAGNTIGLEEHTISLGNVEQGAKVQIYNAARPYVLLYEEIASEENYDQEGNYLLDFGSPLTDVSSFYVVQITVGGASNGVLVSVTDIQGFYLSLSTEEYTTGNITLSFGAYAESGIVSWSIQKDFDEPAVFELEGLYSMREEYIVTENGTYTIVLTSGLGVTYSEQVVIEKIDRERPGITIKPSGTGWKSGAYAVDLEISGIAPVVSYVLYKDGVMIDSAESCPETITFTKEGEYLIWVKNAAGLSATESVFVNENAKYAQIKSELSGSTMKITFEKTQAEIVSVDVYKIKDGKAERMTVLSGNVLNVYDADDFVAKITYSDGLVEMFGFSVTETNLENAGGCSGSLSFRSISGVFVVGLILIVTASVWLVRAGKSKRG